MFYKRQASKGSVARRKPVLGVGTNDSVYTVSVSVNGSRFFCPAYASWQRMLSRVYCEEQLVRFPTYREVTVCDDWLFFSNFAKWYEQNNVEGYDLDKDIKVKGNKVYGPDTCLFVPKSINYLFLDSAGIRGKYPQGVSSCSRTNNYRATCLTDGRSIHIGTFPTPEKAHEAYKNAKNKEIERKMLEYPEFAVYLKQHMYSWEVE